MRKKLFSILTLLLVAAMGAMAQTTYKLSVKGGTEDADKWKSTPAEAMTTGVAATTDVTVSYTGSKIVKSVQASKKALVPPPTGNTIDLSTVTADVTAGNGDVLTGTLNGSSQHYKISIAAGATVTLDGVTINGYNTSDYSWAGITCLGDATIILKDGTTNTVKGFYSPYPGIQAAHNPNSELDPDDDSYEPEFTLIIKGTGTLTVSSNGHACGIGGGGNSGNNGFVLPCGNIEIQGGEITATGGSSSAGIGSGDGSSCGNITISGGKVTATGGQYGAGIGTGGNGSSCGDITISGGEVKATGGNIGAGIGSSHGSANNGASASSCRNITISGGTVEASGGSYCAGIGSARTGSSCGNIEITTGVIQVTAIRKGNATRSIGAGKEGTCGTVTIGGTSHPNGITNSPYKYPSTANPQPQVNETVTMTPTDNPNEWTLSMPNFDVELEIAYFNATAPTATTGDIYAGEETPLITAGTTTGCTMMYKVTNNNTRPTSTTGFSATVPTAATLNKAGTYYVWYYVTDANTNSESQIFGPLSVTVLIDKTDLNDAISDAETYYNSIKDIYSDYPETDNLSDAINEAVTIEADADATLTQIATATTNLNSALNAAKAAVAQNRKYVITVAEDTDDKDNWTIGATSATAGTEVTVTYNGSNIVKSVKAKKVQASVPIHEIIDLSTVTLDKTVENGDILRGELTNNVKISIAPGATVTLDGVTIKGVNNSSCDWAGITCLGDATIILKDGTENTVEGFYIYGNYPGIYVPSDKLLIIKGETAGTGKLTASSRGNGAGIGGGLEIPCGDIEIKGGNITAYGCGYAAGIGSGKGSSCGNITISGGTVTAQCASYFNGYNSGMYGAGIGSGGNGSSCGNITINGGSVTANGGNYGAGIGSGASDNNHSACSCGTITISGGTVEATGGTNQGAGIGSGWRSSCDDITICGGEITATGGKTAAGIGSAGGGKFGSPNPAGSCGNITINGGKVTATGGGLGGSESSPGGKGGSGIGSGYVGKCGDIIITTGVTKVKATKGTDAPNSIGTDNNHTVTIFGTSYPNGIVDDYDENGDGNGSGSQPQEDDNVTITLTKPSEWTLVMPSNAVELKMTCFDVTAPTATTGDIYAGETTPLITEVSTTEGTMKYLAQISTDDAPTKATTGWSTDVPTAADLTTGGTYYVWYYLEATPDDSPILPVEVTVKNPRATIATHPTATTGDIYAGETTQLVTAGVVSGGENPEGTMMYKVTDNNTRPTSTDGFSATVPTAETLTAACTLYVWYYVKGNNTHSDSQISATAIEVTVKNPRATIETAPTATTGDIYAGETTPLITEGTATGGTMKYALGTDNTTAPSTGWGTDRPTASIYTEACTVYVWYYVAGDNTHSDSEYTPVEVTVKAPRATVTTAPAAVTTPIYVSTEANLITQGETTEGTLMYLAQISTADAPTKATTGWSADLPTAENITEPGTYNVYYYIVGDNAHSDSEIFATPITATVLTDKYDITFNAANTYTIEGGQGTVTVKEGTAAAVDKTKDIDTNHKLNQVKMGSKVTISANNGYKVTSVTDGTNTLSITADNEFTMPASNVTVSYTLKRDMAVDVTAVIAKSNIHIRRNSNNIYEADIPTQIIPVVTDVLGNGSTQMVTTTDYTASLQKKGDNNQWTDETTLSVGTFRYKVTGEGLYDGFCYSNEFNLFEGYEVEIAAGEFVTYFRNENLYIDDTEAKLYTITSVDGTTATATELNVAAANTPLLVKNNSTATRTILLIPTESQADNVTAADQFVGTLTATTIKASTSQQNNYAFNGKQFVWVKNDISVGANKAWLAIPTANNARTITLVFEEEETGLSEIANAKWSDGDWYDLNGRKLPDVPNRKGVYIINGKKVVIK